MWHHSPQKCDSGRETWHGRETELVMALGGPEPPLLLDCFLYLGGMQELQDPQAA